MADNGQYLTPIFDHSKEQNMYHVNLLLSSTEDEQVNFNVNKLYHKHSLFTLISVHCSLVLLLPTEKLVLSMHKEYEDCTI